MTFFVMASLFLVAIIFIGFLLILSSTELIWKLMINSLVGFIIFAAGQLFYHQLRFCLTGQPVYGNCGWISRDSRHPGLIVWQIWL